MTDQGAPTPTPTPPPEGGTVAAAQGKADITKRLFAAIIDGVIAGVLGFVPVVGGIVGALYILLRDGFEFEFMDLRSIGKRVMKLRPVRLDGQPMSLAWSVRRNWTLVFASLALVPLIGWVLAPLFAIVGAILGIMEAIFVVTDAEGRRWGDRLANTKVIETES